MITLNHLERRIADIRRRYPRGEMSAKDISREENCSPRTARRRMKGGEFTDRIDRNSRVKAVSVDCYIEYLRSKTVILKASA